MFELRKFAVKILIATTCLRGVGEGKVSGSKRKYFAVNWVNWKQVSKTIGYKKEMVERKSFSDLKMGRDSICKEFQNVPQ